MGPALRDRRGQVFPGTGPAPLLNLRPEVAHGILDSALIQVAALVAWTDSGSGWGCSVSRLPAHWLWDGDMHCASFPKRVKIEYAISLTEFTGFGSLPSQEQVKSSNLPATPLPTAAGTKIADSRFRRVLVLNASYEPLSLIPVRRAVILLMQSKAELVECARRRAIRSVGKKWPLPLIIRLSYFVFVPSRSAPPTRNAVMLRDGHRCGYCGQVASRHRMTIDHVVPRSQGGTHSWSNLITACHRCNQRKGHHRPEQVNMQMKWQPSQPSHVSLILLRNPVAAERYRYYMSRIVEGEPATTPRFQPVVEMGATAMEPTE